MRKHLYQDRLGTIHLCEKGTIHDAHVGQSAVVLVWTKCEKDVPTNQSFESDEHADCEACLAKDAK